MIKQANQSDGSPKVAKNPLNKKKVRTGVPAFRQQTLTKSGKVNTALIPFHKSISKNRQEQRTLAVPNIQEADIAYSPA